MKRSFVLAGALVLSTAAFSQSFTDGFEGATYNGSPATSVTSAITWTVDNNSTTQGTVNWFNGNDAVFPAHGGVDYAGANFNSTTGTNDISNWLISDNRTFTNGDTISFWTRTVVDNPFPDRLELRFSSAGASLNTGSAAADVGDFTTLLVSVNPNLVVDGYPEAWTQFSATLSGLGGPTSGRFAFRYWVTNGGPTGANSNYIGVDDVEYTAVVPEPASMAALGLGALALIRRRRNR